MFCSACTVHTDLGDERGLCPACADALLVGPVLMEAVAALRRYLGQYFAAEQANRTALDVMAWMLKYPRAPIVSVIEEHAAKLVETKSADGREECLRIAVEGSREWRRAADAARKAR